MVQETENKKKKKVGELIVDNLQRFTILLISLVYIFQGIFNLTKKDATLVDILGNVGMSVAVGLILSSSFVSMGLKDGKKSPEFQTSLKVYGETKAKATPKLDKLAPWCEFKNVQELEYKKRDIIQAAGLSWKAYKFGYYDEHQEKLNEEQKQALERAKKCSISKLSSQELLSDLPSLNDKSLIFKNKSRFGQTEKEYQAKVGAQDAFFKIFIAVVCGLYGLTPLVTEENFGDVIAGVLWHTMQIIMWLTFGVTKYFNSKSFIENEYRQTHIIQKTEYLNEFIATMDNNPKVIEQYDDELEVDKYIIDFINKRKEIEDGRNKETNGDSAVSY